MKKIIYFCLLIMLFCLSSCEEKKVILDKPNLVLKGNLVSWDKCDNAKGYLVYVNDEIPYLTYDTSYEINDSEIKEYKVKVKCISDDEKLLDSDLSNEVVYHKLASILSAPKLSISSQVVSWKSIDNATSYEIYVNGKLKDETNKTTYFINENEIGEYKVTVIAKSISNNFINSPLSNEVTYTINQTLLVLPDLKIDGNIVSWNKVPNAKEYEVYIDRKLVSTQEELSYEINITETGKYEISVKSIASSDVFHDSDFSYAVTYVVKEKLSTPVINITNNIISWEKIEKASEYEIYNNDVLLKTTNELSYDLNNIANNYVVKIKAVNKENDLEDSDFSNIIKTFVKGKILEYKFEDNTLDTSGNNNNGKTVNEVEYLSGVKGKAIYLNGDMQYITLPNNIISSYEKVTISFYVNEVEQRDFARLFDFGTIDYVNHVFFSPYHLDDNCILQSNGVFSWARLEKNTWIMVTIILKGDKSSVYLNGEKAFEINIKKPNELGDLVKCYIGKSGYGETDPYLKAYVDEFVIYNYELTSEEISSLYRK